MSETYSRIALVTGGNGDIGFELVKQLAEKGNKVYVGARNEEAGKQAVARLKDQLLEAQFVRIDVTDDASIKAAKDLIEKNEGRLDVLVNNAAVVGQATVKPSELDPSDPKFVFEANVFGVINLITTFMPLIKKAKSGYGVILNVSSAAGSNSWRTTGPSGYRAPMYAASKAALNSYSIALANELRDEKIRVNVVCPGLVSTKLNGYNKDGKTPAEGAALLLPWALLGPEDDDKTCKFYSNGKPIDW